MLEIKMEITGMDDIRKMLADMPGKIQNVAQRTILKTAQQIRDAEKAEMQRVFDRPTRWTLGAMQVKVNKDNKNEVTVGIIDPDGYYKRAASYLGVQTEGGQRKLKAMEKALQQYGLLPGGWFTVPGAGAQMDGNGNMSVGQIRQILSYFGTAERWAGSTQNMTQATKAKLRKGSAKKLGFEYFVVFPDKRRNLKQPGIYQRFFFGHGRSIKPILIYVKGTRYQARFNFERVARDTADAVMQTEFNKALQIEMAK